MPQFSHSKIKIKLSSSYITHTHCENSVATGMRGELTFLNACVYMTFYNILTYLSPKTTQHLTIMILTILMTEINLSELIYQVLNLGFGREL